MKYDPGKAYLYPVLRPGGEDRDYPHAEFEAELNVERIEGQTAVRASASFALSAPDLLALVGEGVAKYVLLVRAPASHHRSAHTSPGPEITAKFGDGELAGRTEVRGLLVAVKDLQDFRADGWNPDYEGMSFDIGAGSVLAEDEPKEYWIDNAEEADIGSFFDVVPDEKNELGNGQWRCDLHDDKVHLRMSVDDFRSFKKARKRVNEMGEALYVMNGVYLPALVYALQQADATGDDYAHCRWYRSLNARLAELRLPELGDGANRLADAQRLLEEPFRGALALWAGDAP